MDGAECWQKRVSGAHAVLWVEFDLYLGEPARDGRWDGVHKSSRPCLLDRGTRKINKGQEAREGDGETEIACRCLGLCILYIQCS